MSNFHLVAHSGTGSGAWTRWTRAPRRVALVVVLAGFLLLGGTTGLASASSRNGDSKLAAASNGAAVAVGVNKATITSNGGPGGNCTWLVDSTVTVVNLTGSAFSVANENGSDGRVDWSDASSSGSVTPDTVMTWPNSSTGYGTVPANSSLDGTADSTFTIPCDATDGELSLNFHISPGTYPDLGTPFSLSGDTPFLQHGTPLPILVGLGGLVFSGAMGGLLLVRMGRRRPAASTR